MAVTKKQTSSSGTVATATSPSRSARGTKTLSTGTASRMRTRSSSRSRSRSRSVTRSRSPARKSSSTARTSGTAVKPRTSAATNPTKTRAGSRTRSRRGRGAEDAQMSEDEEEYESTTEEEDEGDGRGSVTKGRTTRRRSTSRSNSRNRHATTRAGSQLTPKSQRLAERLAMDTTTSEEDEEDESDSENEGRRSNRLSSSSSRDRRRVEGDSASRSSSQSSSQRGTPTRSTKRTSESYSSVTATSTTTYKTPSARGASGSGSGSSGSSRGSRSAPNTGVLSSIASSLASTPLATLFMKSGAQHSSGADNMATAVPKYQRPYTRSMEQADKEGVVSKVTRSLGDLHERISAMIKGHEGDCDESCIDKEVRATANREGHLPVARNSSSSSSSSDQKYASSGVSPIRSIGGNDRAGLDPLHQAFAFLALLSTVFIWTNYASHVVDIIPLRYPNDSWTGRFWKGYKDFVLGNDTHPKNWLSGTSSGMGILTFHFFWLSCLFSTVWFTSKLIRQVKLRSKIAQGHWAEAIPAMLGTVIAFVIGWASFGPACALAVAAIVSRAWSSSHAYSFKDHMMTALAHGAVFILASWYTFHDVTRMVDAKVPFKSLVQSSFGSTPILAALSWELVFFSLTAALIMCSDMYNKMPWLNKYLAKEDGSFYSTWASCFGSLFVITLLTGGVALPALYFMISELLLAFKLAPGTTPSYLTKSSAISMSAPSAFSSSKAKVSPGARSFMYDLPSPSHRIH